MRNILSITTGTTKTRHQPLEGAMVIMVMVAAGAEASVAELGVSVARWAL
ncbi:MAG: hypothetical protein ACYTEQ_18110 [Planctomycetota bacterium]